jgi:allantoate deiminase
VDDLAAAVVARCRALAQHSEDPAATTRTFLSAPMRAVHHDLRTWMERLGLDVRVDAVGNLRGIRRGITSVAPRPVLLIGSHLDTVPDAGAFDGVLGVVLGVALVEALGQRSLPFDIEVVGFSEEEGVRFGAPFIGSRALVGTVDDALLSLAGSDGQTVRDAIAAFGLDLRELDRARLPPSALGYLEFHIEQGPVLDALNLPIGIVDAIAGQSRRTITFTGQAAHAGTTPMTARRDALAGAAEWVLDVERHALAAPGLVATVGRLQISPGAGNVVAAAAVASLDVRHASDAARTAAVAQLIGEARAIASRRGLTITVAGGLEQASVPMDPQLTNLLDTSARACGVVPHHLTSGAGHDAMVLAARVPVAMVFVRSPGGLSHHPAESVRDADVAVALQVGVRAVEQLASEVAR